MSGRRVLIAGGAGFIGSHLCELFLRTGDTVICLDNMATGDSRNVAGLIGNERFEPLPIDVCDVTEERVDLVLHLASAASPVHYRRLSIETLLANSVGTQRLLELARANNCPFIYFSTSEAYGDPLVHPQREDYWGNVNPIGPRACYDEGKRFGEALTMEYHRRYGLTTTILRLFNTYGPRMALDDGRAIPAFFRAALRHEPLPIQGDGRQTRSFCYIDDLVGAVQLVADAPHAGGIFNVGNPAEMTILELAQAIGRLTGAPFRLQHLPPAEDDPARRCPDISRIKAEYGWAPRVPLEDGLASTLADFAERMQIRLPEYSR